MNLPTKDLLHSLAITGNYHGYSLTVTAIKLVLEDSSLLYNVTKRLYPQVADLCGCKTECVERNIRTVILHAWKVRRDRLNEIAGYTLSAPPSVTEFLDMTTLCLQKTLQETARK